MVSLHLQEYGWPTHRTSNLRVKRGHFEMCASSCWWYVVLGVLVQLIRPSQCDIDAAKKLYDTLFYTSGYNKFVRPVANVSEIIEVTIGLKLSQLIDVDEKNQYMITNVWMIHEWRDPTLTWDPKEYGNVDSIYVPVNDLWHPDIVLYNTADGTYETTNGTNAQVKSDGQVRWRPPASFKVSCTINVEYFPFDEQACAFEFGSWTYNKFEVDIQHVHQKEQKGIENGIPVDQFEPIQNGTDLQDFQESVEWDILAVPAEKVFKHYAGSVEPFTLWKFHIILRRRFLFYTVNLIIPLISHSFITILVFYIPGASGEKMNLSINILLSLTVFFLMLSDIIPQSSLFVPLLGKYLLFTLILVATSVIVTCITYNVHFRSSSTHIMSNWTRKIFLYWLPKILMMKRPKIENSQDVNLKYIKLRLCSCLNDDGHDVGHGLVNGDGTGSQYGSNRRTRTQTELINLSRELDEDRRAIRKLDLSVEVQRAVEGALFIANHLKKEDQFQRTKEDWKYVALVIDRVFLWTYGAVCLFGTIAIVCYSPSLYDDRLSIGPGSTRGTS